MAPEEHLHRMKRTQAVEITVLRDTWGSHQDGSFKWIKAGTEIIGLEYLCPCGCRTVGEIRFARPGDPPRSPTYVWDGNREEPTLSTAFEHVVAGQVHWSGILQRGEWIGVEFGDDDEPEWDWEERKD
jgi:hypothetical protein